MATTREIDDLLHELAKPPRKQRDDAYERVAQLAAATPNAINDLVVGAVRKHKRRTNAIADLISHLSLDELRAAADVAVDALAKGIDADESQAADLVARVSLQAPAFLEPHLPKLARLRPNRRTYYEHWPWRAARSDESRRALVHALEARKREERYVAALRLLETRSPEHVEVAANALSELATKREFSADELVREVGFDRSNRALRRLAPRTCFHVSFPAGTIALPRWAGTRTRVVHPTWRLGGEAAGDALFGGVTAARCRLCGAFLHRLLAVPKPPSGLGVDSRPSLTIATCLSCLGWQEDAETLFFSHDEAGEPEMIDDGVAPRPPEFPADPLPELRVRLVPTPDRWLFQSWGISNGRENLNRLGGEPTWIQYPAYPACAQCHERMSFLLQLDSLMFEDGREWLWGDAGILYACWCDRCAVSATSWQST